MRWILTIIFITTPLLANAQTKGNRLAYLDELDPYYPNKDFPKLITPQWVGEPGVDAVVILGIDDMRDTKRYETYLRPILNRLKKIDGRAALSIMTCKVKPDDPQLQKWLKEGVSIETHTYDHPCPIFKKGFKFAKDTYDKAVDLMFEIPDNKPVAFRMPCCDSLNTPSPRFWAEIFNKTTTNGKFLSIDTSVFNVFTSADKELPRKLVLENGRERFRKYAPKDRHFVNYIENYPYPYVIGRLCWEFPCVTPSDWSAQHYHGKNNPITIKDWQHALDCTVVKKGVFCLVFHPHGWIRNDQIVQLIDYAQEKYGKRVKFLNFREALERLQENVGYKNSRLVDINRDDYLDVISSSSENRLPDKTRIWNSKRSKWRSYPFPSFIGGHVMDFGSFQDGEVWLRYVTAPKELGGFRSAHKAGFYRFNTKKWVYHTALPVHLSGAYIRDVNGNDVSEIITVDNIFFWKPKTRLWKKTSFQLPAKLTQIRILQGWIHGHRFLDLNNDNKLDIIFSNEKSYGVYLFTDMKRGWSKKIIAGKQGDGNAIPPIVRNGTNNGFFVHGRSLYWANEDTALLKDHVRRITFEELLKKASRRRKPSEKPARQSRGAVPSQAEPGTERNLTAGAINQKQRSEIPFVLDVNDDGYLDVIAQSTRIWIQGSRKWSSHRFPDSAAELMGNFGIFGNGKTALGFLKWPIRPSLPARKPGKPGLYHFDRTGWKYTKPLLAYGMGGPYYRDIDDDGVCEAIAWNEIHSWNRKAKKWARLPFTIPADLDSFLQLSPYNPSLRFLDLNNDNKLDIIFSNEKSYGVYLFTDMKRGWSKKIIAGKQGDGNAIPPIVRNGTNNGFFVHGRSLYWANEDTALLKDHVRRITFEELLKKASRRRKPSEKPARQSRGAVPSQAEPGTERNPLCAPLRPLRLNPPAPPANAGGSPMPKPKSPAESLKTIQTRPGFTVELVAAEPLVKDPIAINWGIEDGKLWVVEMGDYPNGVDGKPGGRVKFLTDSNKDGKYDKATIFLDKLPFPTGVTPWKKGVLITAAPDIIYAEDTTGDGKADVRKVLYTGFREGNQQHRVNGLWWGLDGWLYGANGDSGGVVKSIKTGKSVNISGRDFRIKPDEGLIEPVTGQTQFGRCRDDWGNWFGCNNSFPLFHFVLPDRYLRRNPHVKYPPAKINVIPRNDRIYPISKPLPRFNDHHTLNKFTSACSAMIYRDDFFGPEFYGNAFIAEPVHNLISRRILTPKGVTFTAKRAKGEEKSEFLASTDNWFRPTMVRMGPDGALWIADMYRLVIEHPQWIPKDWQAKLDLRSGHDRGRIYRVVPVGKKVAMKSMPGDWIEGFSSPNGFMRDSVHQLHLPLLSQRKPTDPVVTLVSFDHKFPDQGQTHVLHLFGFSPGKDSYFSKWLDATNPYVRCAAIRAAERLFQLEPGLAKMTIPLANDKNPMVRMQLAFSLGHMGKVGANTLAKMALREHDNPYIFAAILSSISKNNIDAVFQEVMTAAKGDVPRKVVQQLLHLNQAYGRSRNLGQLLQMLTRKGKSDYTPGQMSVVAEWLDSISDKQLQNILYNSELELKAAARQLKYFVASARDVLSDKKSSANAKRQAIRLLGRGILKVDEEIEVLVGFLKATVGPVLQEAAVESLARSANPQAVGAMFAAWKQLLPARRSQVVGVVLQNSDGPDLILDQLAKKHIAPSEIDAVYRQRLLNHSLDRIKNRAKKLFQISDNEDRQKLLTRYEPALKAKGDPKIGMKIFEKTCAACHRLHNIGTEVGPDLAALTDKSKPTLLTAILDPNKAVEAKFLNYAVATTAGRLLSGLIAEETGTSITLVEANGKKHVLLRKDIAQLGGTGKSAMPEGLERDISVEAMPHLLAFIHKGK